MILFVRVAIDVLLLLLPFNYSCDDVIGRLLLNLKYFREPLIDKISMDKLMDTLSATVDDYQNGGNYSPFVAKSCMPF